MDGCSILKDFLVVVLARCECGLIKFLCPTNSVSNNALQIRSEKTFGCLKNKETSSRVVFIVYESWTAVRTDYNYLVISKSVRLIRQWQHELIYEYFKNLVSQEEEEKSKGKRIKGD